MKKSYFDLGKKLSAEEYRELIQWKNDNPELAWRQGDIKEDRVFWSYCARAIDGELWYSVETFDKLKRNRKIYNEKKRLELPVDKRLPTQEEWDEICRFRNENPDLELKHGDIREDGKIFYGYNQQRPKGENWLSPEDYERKTGFKNGIPAKPEQVSFLNIGKRPNDEEWKSLQSWRKENKEKCWTKWTIHPENKNLIFMNYSRSSVNGEAWQRKENSCKIYRRELKMREEPLEEYKKSRFQVGRRLTDEEFEELLNWIKANPEDAWKNKDPNPIYEDLTFSRYGRNGINGEYWITQKRRESTKESNRRSKLKKKPQTEEQKRKKKEYIQNRVKTDEVYKFRRDISGLIRNSLKLKGFRKANKTEEILGCTIAYFKEYISAMFEPWMSFSNHGTTRKDLKRNEVWSIDHIIPLSMAKSQEEATLLNHHLNLRPLCAYENVYVKGDIPPSPEEIERILTSILQAKQKKIIDDLYEKYSQMTEMVVTNK